MAEPKAQTTRGQMLGEKPPELSTVYGPDGTPHSCSPVDAREILAAGLGYTTTPPAAPLTGETIIDAAYAEVANREQQSEQQSKHGHSTSGGQTEGSTKPDNSSGADASSQTAGAARNKARK